MGTRKPFPVESGLQKPSFYYRKYQQAILPNSHHFAHITNDADLFLYCLIGPYNKNKRLLIVNVLGKIFSYFEERTWFNPKYDSSAVIYFDSRITLNITVYKYLCRGWFQNHNTRIFAVLQGNNGLIQP